MNSSKDILQKVARVGFAAKGIVYMSLGSLAVMTAVGAGGQVGGSKDALRTIREQSFGTVILALLAVGLACYSVYRLFLAVTGYPEDEDHPTLRRIGAAGSGLVHGALAFAAALMVVGQSSGGRNDLVSTGLALPGGVVIIAAVGAGLIIGGIAQAYKAFTLDFMEKLETVKLASSRRGFLAKLGRAGLSARAIILAMIGFALVKVAVTEDPSKYEGVGASLSTLSAQTAGNILLGFVAAGLAAYGLYMIACAWYRQLSDELAT